jgi:hypothetical protein
MPRKRYGTFVVPTEYDEITGFMVKRVTKGGPGPEWDDEREDYYSRPELWALVKAALTALEGTDDHS